MPLTPLIGTTELDDSQLAQRACAGDQAAFADLMSRHKHWLYRYVRRYVSSSHDAYDVVQDSFVSAWLALSSYDSARPFTIWLRRIALNKCRDLGRKRKAYRAVVSAFGFASEAFDVPDPRHGPSESGDVQRAFSRLSAAIDMLPASLKDALILTALEGLSQKEAGEILNLNAKAVELRVYRAKKKLAALLDASDIATIVERSD